MMEKNTFRVIRDTIGSCLADLTRYSVRWHGFISPQYAGIYTFQAGIREVFDRFRLWVDHKLVIDQWASLGLAGMDETEALAPSGTGYFQYANLMYDIKMEYKKVDGRYSGASLN